MKSNNLSKLGLVLSPLLLGALVGCVGYVAARRTGRCMCRPHQCRSRLRW